MMFLFLVKIIKIDFQVYKIMGFFKNKKALPKMIGLKIILPFSPSFQMALIIIDPFTMPLTFLEKGPDHIRVPESLYIFPHRHIHKPYLNTLK